MIILTVDRGVTLFISGSAQVDRCIQTLRWLSPERCVRIPYTAFPSDLVDADPAYPRFASPNRTSFTRTEDRCVCNNKGESDEHTHR